MERMCKLGMAIAECPLAAEVGGHRHRTDQMNDALLSCFVVLMTAVHGIEHHGPRTEVERNVVAQGAARCDRHAAREAALLDVQVANIRVVDRPRDALRVAPQPTRARDAGEVVDVRDVEDWWIGGHGHRVAHCALGGRANLQPP